MKKGAKKASAKYIKREFKDGKWVYYYAEKPVEKPKKIDKKLVLRKEDYYGEGRHKYLKFKTETDKKDFLEREKKGMTEGKGKKIKSTAGRMTVGTNIIMKYGPNTIPGKIIASDGTTSKSPTSFDIEYIDKKTGLKKIEKNIPRELLTRAKKAWSQKKAENLEEKKIQNREMLASDINEEVVEKAKELAMSNWDTFSGMAGKYYKKRTKGGWNASQFGFDEEDLKQECYIIIHNAALSFLKNQPKGKKSSFENYVKSFLKANLAAKLAASSGAGGHLKTSGKDQLYLWFFKDILEEHKQKTGRIPSDPEMLDILEEKRKALPDKKGTKTIKDYKWTLEKVKNKKKQSAKMLDLERSIEAAGGGTESLLSILNEEELETFGHYKINPYVEAEKSIVKEEVKKGIERVFQNKSDQQIITRSYGLFVDEDSPIEVRKYAMGQSSGEIADYLNQIEAKKGTKKRWSATMVQERELELLKGLKNSKEFKAKLGDFVKSTPAEEEVWPDAALVMYYIVCYKIIEDAFKEFLPEKKGMK